MLNKKLGKNKFKENENDISLDKINKIQAEIIYLMENKFPDIINTIN